MGVKHTARVMFEKAFGVHLVYRGTVAPVFEKDHLYEFFAHFKVDCVFDVGANAGQYANMLRSDVGYQGDIISFEPIPELAQRLRAKAATGRSWFVEELALDEHDGQASFNVMAVDQMSSLHGVSTMGAGLFKRQTQLSRRIEVRTSTIATQLRKYQDKLGFKRPFLKMDTQGMTLRCERRWRSAGAVRGSAERARRETPVRRQSELRRSAGVLSRPGLRAERDGAEQCRDLPAPVGDRLHHVPQGSGAGAGIA
jgi:FkbM family methyltransferase